VAITLTQKIASSNTSTGNTTTASFTSTAGNRILVFYAPTRSSVGTSDWSSGITCSDSQGAAYTTIGASVNYNNGTNWDVAAAVFIAASNGSSRTVTLSSGVTNYSACFMVYEVSGDFTGSTTGFIIERVVTNGAETLTLTAAPASDDVSLFVRFFSTGSGTVTAPTVTMSTSYGTWSNVGEVNALSTYAGSLALESRTGTTSTTVSCTDTWNATPSVYGGTALAFTLKYGPIASISLASCGAVATYGKTSLASGVGLAGSVGTTTSGACVLTTGSLSHHSVGCQPADVAGGASYDVVSSMSTTALYAAGPPTISSSFNLVGNSTDAMGRQSYLAGAVSNSVYGAPTGGPSSFVAGIELLSAFYMEVSGGGYGAAIQDARGSAYVCATGSVVVEIGAYVTYATAVLPSEVYGGVTFDANLYGEPTSLVASGSSSTGLVASSSGRPTASMYGRGSYELYAYSTGSASTGIIPESSAALAGTVASAPDGSNVGAAVFVVGTVVTQSVSARTTESVGTVVLAPRVALMGVAPAFVGAGYFSTSAQLVGCAGYDVSGAPDIKLGVLQVVATGAISVELPGATSWYTLATTRFVNAEGVIGATVAQVVAKLLALSGALPTELPGRSSMGILLAGVASQLGSYYGGAFWRPLASATSTGVDVLGYIEVGTTTAGSSVLPVLTAGGGTFGVYTHQAATAYGVHGTTRIDVLLSGHASYGWVHGASEFNATSHTVPTVDGVEGIPQYTAGFDSVSTSYSGVYGASLMAPLVGATYVRGAIYLGSCGANLFGARGNMCSTESYVLGGAAFSVPEVAQVLYGTLIGVAAPLCVAKSYAAPRVLIYVPGAKKK